MFLFLITITLDEIKALIVKHMSAYFWYDSKSFLALALKRSRVFERGEPECLVGRVSALWER